VGRDGSTGSMTFDCQWKNIESWEGTKIVVFRSGTMHLLLFKIYKRGLSMQGEWHSLTHYSLWSTVRLSILWNDNHPSATRGRTEQFWKKKGLKIPKGYSEAVNGRTDNTIVKRKRTNNDLSNTTHKTQNRTTRTLLKIRDEPDVFRNGRQFLLH
jgi:hypothetical protein